MGELIIVFSNVQLKGSLCSFHYVFLSSFILNFQNVILAIRFWILAYILSRITCKFVSV